MTSGKTCDDAALPRHRRRRRPDCGAGGTDRCVPEARDARGIAHREPPLAQFSRSLFRHEHGRAARLRAAVPGGRHARVLDVACRPERPDLVGIRRLRPGAAVRRRQRERARFPEPSRSGSNAGGNDVHGRHDRRTDPGVRHLLQLDVPVVGIGSRRHRSIRSGVDRGARDWPPSRPVALGARRDRDDLRRAARDRGRSGHVPDCVLARQHRGSLVEGRRHRRHLRLVRDEHVHARLRERERTGHQERQRSQGRARGGVRSG